MEKRDLICIGCPMGCMMTVSMENGKVMEVAGNTCKRGDIYARKEVTDPTRIVTSSVRVSGGVLPVVSVKTKTDIPKGKISDCMKALKEVEVKAPIQIGDILLKNVADTGVDVIATKGITQIP
jgi:CxxC motif-containing protein